MLLRDVPSPAGRRPIHQVWRRVLPRATWLGPPTPDIPWYERRHRDRWVPGNRQKRRTMFLLDLHGVRVFPLDEDTRGVEVWASPSGAYGPLRLGDHPCIRRAHQDEPGLRAASTRSFTPGTAHIPTGRLDARRSGSAPPSRRGAWASSPEGRPR